MFKTEDSFEDIIIYLFIIVASGIIALLAIMYVVSVTSFLSEPLSVLLGRDWNPILKNPNMLFFIYLFLISANFFSFYIFYNLRKFVPDYKHYIYSLIRSSIIVLLFMLSNKWIRQQQITDIYIINYIIILIISFFSILSLIFVFMSLFPLLFNLIPYNNKLKNNIKNTQYELKELIKESYENKNSNKEESSVNKRLLRILSISGWYTDSIKGLKNSFGYATNFNKINYVGLNNKDNLNETLDHLTISIPFYIFHGKMEQINEMNTHLNNLHKHIGDRYSIAGEPVLTEILKMNDTVKKYFKENSFKLSNDDNKLINKHDYNFFLKKIFTIIILPIVYSLILSKINLNN